MKVQKDSGSIHENKSSVPQLSVEDRRALTDLFALLLEMYIDQNDVTKGCSSECSHNRCSNYSCQT